LHRIHARPKTIEPESIRASGHLGRIRRDHRRDRPERDGERHLDDYHLLGALLREGGETATRRYQERHVIGQTGSDSG